MSTKTESPGQCITYDRLKGFSRLYTTYLNDYEKVAAYYAGDFRSLADRRAAAERAAEHKRDRAKVADILERQNESWDTLDAAAQQNIEHLRSDESVAVVTGQQIGLFTGPLYTIYKSITALQLAERTAEETGRPAVPVFWVEGEDHDFDEVSSVHLLRHNEVVSVRYDPREDGGRPAGEGADAAGDSSGPVKQYAAGENAGHAGRSDPSGENWGPVGRLVLSEGITQVIDKIDGLLPPTDFKSGLMERIRAAYRPGRTLEDAFVALHSSLFEGSGFVYLNPDDPELKELTAPLFARELEGSDEATRRLTDVSERLDAEGYHSQVRAHPTNLFLLDDEGRWPLDAVNGAFELRSRNRSLAQDDLTTLLSREPEAFSPNVVLRPLMQDMLLPTAAYVGGPGEIAYFAQYRPIYEWAGVPMPIIYPRAGVTLVEGKVRDVLDTLDIEVPALQEDLGRLFRRMVIDEMDVDGDFNGAQRGADEIIDALKPIVGEIDQTLERSAEATRTAIIKELGALKERAVRAEKKRQDQLRAKIAKAQVNLFPMDSMQERVINVLYYLNKYSPQLIDELREQLSLDTTEHQLVECY